MARVFVYGTLLPGRLRWSLVEADVERAEPASVQGRLYDTGWGYPAARFDAAGGVIHGAVLHLRPDRAADVVARLDEVETGYRRVEVTTSDGLTVESYDWVGELDGFALIADGRWNAADER